jgi:hypothetical protein
MNLNDQWIQIHDSRLGFLWCSGLFWNLPGLLPPVLGLFMVVEESTPGSVPREVA